MRDRACEYRAGRDRPASLLAAVTWLCAVVLLCACFAPPGAAQETDPSSDPPQAVVDAERLLQRDTVNLPALEQVRTRLAALRDELTRTVGADNVAAQGLEAEIRALGPPPPEGETEPPDTAEQRARLEQELAAARAPVTQARLTLGRVQLLIDSIDSRLRQESRRNLLDRGPTPLLPSAWFAAPGELVGWAVQFYGDIARALSRDGIAQRMRAQVPVSGILMVLGLSILFALDPWLDRRARQRSRHTARGRTLGAGTILVRLLLIAIGFGALGAAAGLLDPQPARSTTVIAALPAVVLIVAAALLLARLVFGARGGIVTWDAATAARARYLTVWLGLFLALETVFEAIERDFRFSAAVDSFLSFALIVFGALPLYLLARQLRRADARSTTADPVADDLRGLVGALFQVVAIASVLVGALGYVVLARAGIVPAVMTLGLLAAAAWLRHTILSLLEEERPDIENAEEPQPGLLPVLLTITLFLALLPLLALIWGARATDIGEVWRLLTEGVEVGGVRLSAEALVVLIVTLMAGIALTRWLQRLLRSTILPRTRLDSGARESLVTGLGYVGFTLAVLIAVSTAGINLSALAVIFGALSVGLGFGLQNIVSNFVSGIILLIERPVKVGDWIEVAGHSGFVRKIAVRSTRIETFDRFDVIVPNSELIAGVVKNMTLTNMDGRIVIPVGVGYDSDVDVVQRVLLEAAANHPRVLEFPRPMALFMDLGDSALLFELRCFIPDVGQMLTIRSEVLTDIFRRLRAEGVEIPFPQRDVSFRGVEELARAEA